MIHKGAPIIENWPQVRMHRGEAAHSDIGRRWNFLQNNLRWDALSFLSMRKALVFLRGPGEF